MRWPRRLRRWWLGTTDVGLLLAHVVEARRLIRDERVVAALLREREALHEIRSEVNTITVTLYRIGQLERGEGDR